MNNGSRGKGQGARVQSPFWRHFPLCLPCIRIFLIFIIVNIIVCNVMPAEGAVERGEDNVCIECHGKLPGDKGPVVIDEWKKSWHYQHRIFCHDCHGGDPQDDELAMSPERGFTGVPGYTDVPSFCGKCHMGIMNNYLASGHGKALMASGTGPNCVTCHGFHNIQKAGIDIINESLCSRCHPYERAESMKQALFTIEKKINNIDRDLSALKQKGSFLEEEDKVLFRETAEFRTLFHASDVSVVKEKTDETAKSLRVLEDKIKDYLDELYFRRNYSIVIMLIFICIGILVFLYSRGFRA